MGTLETIFVNSDLPISIFFSLDMDLYFILQILRLLSYPGTWIIS